MVQKTKGDKVMTLGEKLIEIGSKMRSALNKLGIQAQVMKKAAEQEEIKTQLMAKHGVQMGEMLFDAALSVTENTEMTLKEAADFVEDRKRIMDEFAANIKRAWEITSVTVSRALDNIMTAMGLKHHKRIPDHHKHIIKSSYKKGKSQRKNWSKWKKRGRK